MVKKQQVKVMPVQVVPVQVSAGYAGVSGSDGETSGEESINRCIHCSVPIEWAFYATSLNLRGGYRRVQIGVPQSKSNAKVDPVFMEPHVVIEEDPINRYIHCSVPIEWTYYATPLNLRGGSRRVQIGVLQNKSNAKVDPVFMEPHVVIEEDPINRYIHCSVPIEWTYYATPLNLRGGTRRVQIGVPHNKSNAKVDPEFMEPHAVIKKH